jgi:hypothetical protein
LRQRRQHQIKSGWHSLPLSLLFLSSFKSEESEGSEESEEGKTSCEF